MSTLEQTVSMLEALPEDDVRAIRDITYRFYIRECSPFKPLTKDQMLNDLAVSREQIENGECLELGDAIEEIEAKYGL
jgi:uncharacterized protein YjiS (DUF1127 family)